MKQTIHHSFIVTKGVKATYERHAERRQEPIALHVPSFTCEFQSRLIDIRLMPYVLLLVFSSYRPTY